VHRGDQFRHLGHLDARGDERPDRAAHHQRREQQPEAQPEIGAEPSRLLEDQARWW
jgi:hypothetical protein